MTPPRFVLVVGATRTASIDGISAAGADPQLRWHTPAADAELVEYGRTIDAPTIPVSPTGCPTPALVTRAAKTQLDFSCTIIEAGLAAPTAAPTVSLGVGPGTDIRAELAVSEARRIVTRSSELGAAIPEHEMTIGESIPGGTTTALGVLRTLGEPYGVSSSLPQNPLDRKLHIVDEGLAESDIDEGDLSGNPVDALRLMGDPVLAATFGIARGALRAGTDVTLAGGTQMIAVAALLRHGGVEAPIDVATTSYVAGDESADFLSAATDLDLDPVVTDPGFGALDNSPLHRYTVGEAKEGVGMGGALALAARRGEIESVRRKTVDLYEAVSPDGS